MAEYQITYWRNIPSMVIAKEGPRNRHKVELPARFQVAIDEAAMRAGATGTDAYLDGWVRSDWSEQEGLPQEVAQAMAAQLEADYPAQRIRALLDEYGPSAGGQTTPQSQDTKIADVPIPHPLVERLRRGGPLLGDGALGTMLQNMGLTDGGAPELWNVEQPEKVRAIYQGYVDAGSHIISTNTFGGTSARLQLHDLQDRVQELNKVGTLLAREVADGANDVLVAASIGPSGELIEPLGDLSMEDAAALFAEQAAALAQGGADFILIETMSDLREVEAAYQGIQQTTDLPVAITLTFDTHFHTMMGVSPKQALETLASWGVQVVGANCGNGPEEIQTIMTEMAQYRPAGVVLYAQSNAGLPVYEKGVISYTGTPEVMATYARQMRDLGVNIIGGCCGTTPAHLQAMQNALKQVQDEPVAGPPPATDSDKKQTTRRDRTRTKRRK